MNAAVEQPGACAVCGGPLPPHLPHGGRRVVCGPECSRLRNLERSKRYWRDRRGVSPRPGYHGVKELVILVERDRAPHGELAGVEWSADDCPRRRGDTGPCIHVGCRYHACADITSEGGLWIDPAFETNPYSVPVTCRIDDATVDPDGETLDQIGQRFHLTRERIRQIEARALSRLSHPSRGAALRELLELSDETERPSTPLGRLQGDSPRLGGLPSNNYGQGVRVADIEPPPCRHPSSPHAAPAQPRRVLRGLPPSLAQHVDELEARNRARGGGWSHGRATRAEVAEIVELRLEPEPMAPGIVDGLVDLGIAPEALRALDPEPELPGRAAGEPAKRKRAPKKASGPAAYYAEPGRKFTGD
jgi:hypothetical protein